MTSSPGLADRANYYCAALAALRFVEQRRPTGRRFGADADARWASFRGDLATADRIDLLLRDADAEWPHAFGARTVFTLRAVAEDEPFGAEWAPLDPVAAEDLWRATLSAAVPQEVRATLELVASAWGLGLAWPAPGAIRPADRLVVAGPSAIAAAIVAFAGGAQLDWADQVTCFATPPAHRQMAALGVALLNLAKPTRLLAADAAGSVTAPAGARLIVSDDADPRDAAAAQQLMLGGAAGGAR